MQPATPVVRTPPDTLRLSASQRRLAALLRRGIAPRHTIEAEIAARVDRDRLRRALAELLRRHDVLRSYFPQPSADDVSPVGIADEVASPLAEYDLSAVPADLQDRRLADLHTAIQEEPCDLERQPYARVILARLGPARYHLLLALPALTADGRSLDALLIELDAIYAGGGNSASRHADAAAVPPGGDEPQEPEATPFYDIVRWRGTSGRDDVRGMAAEFWRRHLADVPWQAAAPVPGEPQRPAGTGAPFLAAAIAWELPGDVRTRMSSRTAADRAEWLRTHFAAAAAIWQARLTERSRVHVGIVADGRGFDELRQAIGPYEQCLPLVVTLDSTTSISSLVGAVRHQLDELHAWQDWFSLDHRGDGLPLEHASCPVCVDVRVTSGSTGGPRTIVRKTSRCAGEPFSFQLACEVSAESVCATLCYDAARYTRAAIERVRQQLNTVLSEIASAEGQTRATTVTLLGPGERDALRDAPVPPMPSYLATLPELIERQAKLAPDAIALVDGDRAVSYGAVQRAVRDLALRLRAHWPLGPDALVGVRMHRSVDAIVAILAILDSGAAYLPLDPEWPRARTEAILRDAGAIGVIAGAIAGEGDVSSVATLYYEAGLDVTPHAGVAITRRAAISPDHLAYVLYTSGTSGVPKGVMVTHGGLTNYLTWAVEAYDLATGRGAIVHSSLAFDFTVTCLLAPLIAGRTVFICGDAHPLDALVDVLSREDEIGAIKLTPTAIDPVWRLVERRDRVARVRCLIVGGEALNGTRQLGLLAHRLGAAIVNEYGPTECVVGSSVYELPAVETPRWQTDTLSAPAVPIGRAIAHTTLHVLARDGQPVPTWGVGEIHIGGWGVARGYLHKPALTAAAFIPHAGAEQPGERIYRTGDQGSYGHSNDLVYLGRRDAQIKIRGHRVERAEVEQALRGHPAVRTCAVIVAERADTHAALVAFIVRDAGTAIDIGEVRRYLATSLPEYMLPTSMHVVSALPATVNGKLDEAALREAVAAAPRPVTAPRSDAERAIHRLWRELLRRDEIGIDENFFELGGDSILSIQFLARANDAGVVLRPRDIEEHPTIAELAAIAAYTGQANTAGPACEDATEVDVPLAPIQHRFFEWQLREPQRHNQSVLLASRRRWREEDVQRALRAVVQHHDALRLSFVREADGRYRQRLAAPAPGQLDAMLERVDLADRSETACEEALRGVAERVQQSLRLDAAPLLRVVWATRRDPQPDLFYVVAHHLIIDHVSWAIVLDDLRSALEQAADERDPIALPARTASYRAWTEHQQARAGREPSAREREYWLSDRWALVPSVHVDRPEALAHNVVRDEASVSVGLGRSVTGALLQETSHAYNTHVLDLLVAAYALAYARWNGTRTMTIDMERHGRDDGGADAINVTRTVGWFTSMHPVYIPIQRMHDVAATIRDVKEALRAVPGDGSGYGRLRYLSDPQTRQACAAIPSPQVSFNYLGDIGASVAQDSPLSWAGWSPAENRAAENVRPHVIDVGIRIDDGELRATFAYSTAIHDRTSIAALADEFGWGLRRIIAHCLQQKIRRFTPSDFPLAALTQERLDAIAAAHPDLEDVYPLSHTQKGLLFHATQASTPSAYLVQLQLTFDGALDGTRFEQSWRQVIARHPVLRTSFLWESVPEPLQIVHRQVDPAWIVEDWRDVEPKAEEHRRREALRARLETWLQHERALGLDLGRPPLHRFALFRTHDDRYEFVWTYPHILLDGWSTSTVLRDGLSFYAEAGGRVVPPRPRPRRYRDYIAYLQARPPEADRAYWASALDGIAAGTRLALPAPVLPAPVSPVPAPAPASGASGPPADTTVTSAHAQILHPFDPATASGIAELARSRQVTQNVVVQAAWALVLRRYARTDDVVFGVTVAGRSYDLPELDEYVGLLLNTLPMRVRIDRAQPVAALLGDVQARLQELLRHVHTPLVDVQRVCRLSDREPLFDTIVVFENFPAVADASLLGDDLRVEGLASIENTNYPLTIVVGGQGAALSIKALYDSARFESTHVTQILTHLEDTLRWMTRSTGQRLDAVDEAWSHPTGEISPARATVADPAWDRPIHHLFETRAAATPDAIAIVDGDIAVTYAALDRRSNQLARHLIGRGVRPGGFVGVCLERSAGMITAVMAVLKTGAAYVPIDARFPAERIALLASRGDVVLVDRFSRRSVDGVSVPVVDLEAEAAQIDRMSSAHPGVDVIGDQVAYLMHTSGSSGQPKGTLVTHRNVTAMLAAAFSRYPSQTGGVWSFFHSIAFDFSVWEVFGALLSGGRVAVTPYWLARSPDRFAEFVRRAQVTMLSQTPSAFQELLTNGRLVDDDAGALSLQWVVFGGEALHLAPLRRFWPLLSRHGVRLLNMYGITETTVHVTHRPMDDLDALDDRRSRIGAALPHLRLAVVDARLRPVPEGVAGELVVGGEGVAIGYADAPRLTAERFVPSPFEGDEGRRLYRSGDLGRALGASDVEYLGRSDRQVKVRGFRIELEEVRFYLLRHTSERDAVRDAVVQVVEDRAGDRVLAAFVAPASPEFDVAALRQRLRTQLPEHMIPAALHVVDRFPLTANGKIDYAALIALAANGPAARRIVLPPQTWEQDLIAEVWRDLLGVPEVGIHDSFFALGGDSIKALRVTARLRSLGLPATTEALFHHPTVAELSRALSSPSGPLPLAPRDGDATAPRDEEKSGSSLAWPPGVIDAYPVTQMQLGMLFHAAQADGTSVPYHNVTVITLQGGFDEARFRDALARLVAAHETLRTAFHLEAAVRPMQLVYECVETPLTVERPGGLSAAAERAHIDEWVAREKTAAFAIERAPLIRFHVMACGPERWHLGITEHHAILDGWSVARLLTELFERYCGLDAPDDTPRPRAERLNVCREYALLERAALSSPAHEAFWRDYLDDYVPLQLPVRWDDDLPDASSGAGACAQPPLDRQTRDVVRIRRRAIEPAVAAGLRSLAVEAQSPVKSVLLAAHMAVLAAATNTPDTITGVITHGRPEVDGGEAGLGLFLNTLPFRLKQAHVSWTRWIRAVFDEERRTLPYRRYPLAAMRDRSGRPPELSAAFNYTNFHIYERLAHDAAVSATDLEVHESTNFDWLTTFSVMARTGELELTLAYRTRTFSDAQAEALLDGYTHCLARMVAEPAALMSSRPLWDDAVPPGAPGALASIAAASAADRAPEATIHDLLEHAKGAARADRILAVDGDRQLSAQALWRRVRTASAYLRQLGVSFEQPVAVLLDKSLEWLIAALAIFDAGAVYAPIDPSDPAERVRYIISDTGAAVLITDAAGARTAEGLQLRTVRVDRDELGAGSSMPAVAGERMPQALAYILYTSGSTGVPKGVGLPHGALANLLQWQTRAMPLIHERILQYASVGFDVSVQEILSAIVGGSALVLVPSRLRRDFVALSHVVAEQQVSCLFAADTVIKALLLAGDAEGLPLDSLTTIVNAGEPLVVDAALARFLDAGGALYNHYGPTESHVVTGTAVARRNASSPRASIGRAIDRTDILILDAWQRPVPPGTLGELHIASANVARGYHRAPKQTARRFVPHPGPDAMPGERVFRTGDLGHRDVQGDIWYRGRTDTQVKLRGYRVELEEVRHALLRHPDVTDAVVTVAGRDREARLAAYVVPARPVDHEALRSFVRVTLPAYMVPAAIIEIPSVPMTRNGKIDQAALAAMAPPARGPSAPRAPLSPLEARLRVLWSEVLQRDADLSRDDDFLLAGGTSILLLQLQLKIHSAFAVRVPLASLAVHSSLAEMSACLGDLIEAGAPSAVPGPAAVTRGGDTSCRTSA